MKKYLPLFLLLIFAAGWSPADMFPVYKNLQSSIVSQLSETFGREVAVESVSGTLVNQVELNNVSIAKEKKLSDGTIIKASKIVVHYNPIKMAASGGNILSAVTKIEIIDPEILVDRSVHDEWNVARLIPMARSKKNEKQKPISITANIEVSGGHGLYVDHMGWGEDLKGKAFVSKFKDLSAEIKIAGSRISISKGKATSIVDNSVAYANVTGNINTRTGKYLFVVRATDVDVEKWGYYTMNIPNFKAWTGKSDMTLTMTNPPPRKKGLPILFDGRFNIKNGKATIFGMEFLKANGFVRVYDEEVTFKDLTGYNNGIPVTANGRLYDFSVANYDIDLSIPNVSDKKIKDAIPQLRDIPFTGNVKAKINIGGNYSSPLFSVKIFPDGNVFERKIKGSADLLFQGSVLRLTSDDLHAFNTTMHLRSIVDFAPAHPNMIIKITCEAVALRDVLNAPFKGRSRLSAYINGNTEKLNVAFLASGEGNAVIRALGTYEAGILDMSAQMKDCDLDNQRIKGITFDLRYSKDGLDLKNADIRLNDRSSVMMSGELGKKMTELTISASSIEAGDLTILRPYLPQEISQFSGVADIGLTIKGPASMDAKMTNSLSVNGKISLSNGYIANENVKEASIDFDWNKNALTLKNSRIKGAYTDALISGTFEAGSRYTFDLNGLLDIADLKPMTQKFGRFFGQGPVNAHIEGDKNRLSFVGDMDISDLRYNDIIFDEMSGSIDYDGKLLTLTKPLTIKNNDDLYVLSGRFYVAKKPSVQLRLDVKKGSLEELSSLADKLSLEFSSKQFLNSGGIKKMISLYPALFRFPLIVPHSLYKAEGDSSHLDEMVKATTDIGEFSKTIKEDEKRNVGGAYSGFLELHGNALNPTGEADFRITNGTWETYSFDNARIGLKLIGGTFEVNSYLKKNTGTFSVNGIYNPLKTASLEILAVNMPVDFLTLFIGKGKSMTGIFNMEASIKGPSSSLRGQADISADNVSLGGLPLDSVDSNISFANNTLFFNNVDLAKGDDFASLTGKVPLSSSEALSVNITMEGSTLGLLTLASEDLSWISGSGSGLVTISGTRAHPKMNGSLVLKDAAVYIKNMDSNLEYLNAKLIIQNNSMATDAVTGKWVGAWTGGNVDKIRISGKIDWDNIFTDKKSFETDLKLSDANMTVDIPDFYKGDVTAKNVSLKGTYIVSKESTRAPTLSGTFELSNGVISMPDMSQRSTLPPLGLDVRLNILKNNYIVAGDTKSLISTDLSNLLLNMEIAGENLQISGTIDNISITGKATFNRGTVSIWNRELTLMDEDRQKDVYGSSLDKVTANEAVFSGGSLPAVTLAAEITVKDTEKVSEATATEPAVYQTYNVLIITRITGTPFEKAKENGINLSFDSFTEDMTKSPPVLTPGQYNEDEIKVLLLPDFLKGSLGVSERGVGEVDANEVVADYLNSRLNSYFLRSVERDLAKSLDLESLTLEYNFGKDILNLLPEKSPTMTPALTSAPETMYSIGAIKGFFDRFFIDVNYSQAVEDSDVINKSFLDYQLTYKLSPIVSVVYYRQPFSFIETESDYYKVTLKAGFQI